MATNPFLTLLAQAMLGLPIVLPLFFALLFGSAYLGLLMVNAVVALVNGYRQRPPRLLLSTRVMTIVSGLVATLLCAWFLWNIDGRYT